MEIQKIGEITKRTVSNTSAGKVAEKFAGVKTKSVFDAAETIVAETKDTPLPYGELLGDSIANSDTPLGKLLRKLRNLLPKVSANSLTTICH